MTDKHLSLTEAVIAHLLRESDTPLYGLELVRRSASSELQLKKGTVYVTLERMEKKGLVTSFLETRAAEGSLQDKPLVPRRLYTLTNKGEEALKALEQAVAKIPGFLVRS